MSALIPHAHQITVPPIIVVFPWICDALGIFMKVTKLCESLYKVEWLTEAWKQPRLFSLERKQNQNVEIENK